MHAIHCLCNLVAYVAGLRTTCDLCAGAQVLHVCKAPALCVGKHLDHGLVTVHDRAAYGACQTYTNKNLEPGCWKSAVEVVVAEVEVAQLHLHDTSVET